MEMGGEIFKNLQSAPLLFAAREYLLETEGENSEQTCILLCSFDSCDIRRSFSKNLSFNASLCVR